MRAGMARAAAVVALALLGTALAGCGDDSGGGQQQAGTPATPRPGAPGAPGGPKAPQLPEKMHVEDRVICPIPDRPSDAKDGKCDLKAPSCGDHLYCLALAQGSFCEPCPERDGIRHAFKERDFATEQNRDPFQSFLLPQLTIGKRSETIQIDPTKKCPREDQMIATSYSYTDLKLVGIVAQGTQRKVLMMGGPLGYIIKRGDCVGKEKAFVKDIGTGYITFVLDQDASSQRAPEEYSVQLNPKQLAINDPELPQQLPRTTIAPIVAPPTVLPPRYPAPGTASPGTGGAAPAAGSGTAGSAAAGSAPAPGSTNIPAGATTTGAAATGVTTPGAGTSVPRTAPTESPSPPIVSPPGASAPVVSPPGTQPTVPQTLAPLKRS